MLRFSFPSFPSFLSLQVILSELSVPFMYIQYTHITRIHVHEVYKGLARCMKWLLGSASARVCARSLAFWQSVR